MNGWTFWIEAKGRFRTVDVFVSDFARAEQMALGRVEGGKVESYTRQPAERMLRICKPGDVREFRDDTPIPRRGIVKRGSKADTAAARS